MRQEALLGTEVGISRGSGARHWQTGPKLHRVTTDPVLLCPVSACRSKAPLVDVGKLTKARLNDREVPLCKLCFRPTR